MSFFQKLFDQLTALWGRSNTRSRGAFVAAAATCVALVGGVGYWSSRPRYVYLASNLAPTETAEIVSRLETEGIQHKMNVTGSAVLVPKQALNKARLAAGEFLDPDANEGSEIGKTFWGDPTLNEYHILRQKEKSLARTIERIDSVRSATVHIARPKPSPFVIEQTATTANVTVELKPGNAFTRRNASSIVKMVASSVQGLDPANVTLTDTSGHTLAAGFSQGETEISNNFEYKRRVETDLEAKAHTMLARMLGEGRAEVRVTADIDFTRIKREEKTVDPEMRARTKEDISSTIITGGSKEALGPAGVASNMAVTRINTNETPYSETTESNNTEYETASTIETYTEDPGRIKRLTIGVMVDLGSNEGADPSTPPVDKAQIEALIKSALGFDTERGDEIQVLVTKLVGPTQDNEQLIQTQTWEFYRDLARNSSLGLASVVALILGLLTLRKFRPLTLPQTGAAEVSAERLRVLSDLSEKARQNPEAMRAIVTSWLDQSKDENDDDQATRAVA